MSRPDLQNLWHAAYRRWWTHRDRNHELRAALWGKVADGLCRVFDRLGLWGRIR